MLLGLAADERLIDFDNAAFAAERPGVVVDCIASRMRWHMNQAVL